MNTLTIYDYHTVSNTRVYCLVSKANMTTVFQTKLFPLTVDTYVGKLSAKIFKQPSHSQ